MPEARGERVLVETDRLYAAYRAHLESAMMAKQVGIPLSVLRDDIEDNGGKLSVVAEFPGFEHVDLDDGGDVDNSKMSRPERDNQDAKRQADNATRA